MSVKLRYCCVNCMTVWTILSITHPSWLRKKDRKMTIHQPGLNSLKNQGRRFCCHLTLQLHLFCSTPIPAKFLIWIYNWISSWWNSLPVTEFHQTPSNSKTFLSWQKRWPWDKGSAVSFIKKWPPNLEANRLHQPLKTPSGKLTNVAGGQSPWF